MRTTTLTPRQAQENLGFPNMHYLACPERKVIICALPKNGCTTIKKWFLSFADPAGLNAPDVHKYCADRWVISLWDGPSRDSAFETFFTMAFLREPLARIASAFIEKFVGGHPYGCFEPARDVIEDCARLAGANVKLDQTHRLIHPDREFDVPASSVVNYDRGITFREFIGYLCRAPNRQLDVHWRPQRCYIWDYRIDYVGQVDDLSASLSAIASRFGLPPPPEPTVLERDQIGGECLADVPSSELYRRFLHDRGRLPPAAALYDDDLRMLTVCRYALDSELYDLAASGIRRIPIRHRICAPDTTASGADLMTPAT